MDPASGPLGDDLERVVDRADLDELVRRIDALCASRQWQELYRLRSLTRAAITTGRQVWPATTLAEYRLALLAPAEWACRILNEDTSRFGIGPLTEVVAQNHVWSDVADLLDPGPRRELVAHERALRGDEVVATDHMVLDLPPARQWWEPDYDFPTYGDSDVSHPNPLDGVNVDWRPVSLGEPNPGSVLDDEDTDDAVRRLVEPWTTTSDGRARAVVVEGKPVDALAHLSLDSVEIADLDAEQAVHWLVWCGASGGAHGRRRGMASGRFGAWWLLAAMGGFVEAWDDLHHRRELSRAVADTVSELKWSRWRSIDRHGYELRLCAHNPGEGISFALSAHDDAETTPPATSAAL
ncbi:MAG: hypothetical protein ACKOYO_03150 [Actinomycetota bacterium]